MPTQRIDNFGKINRDKIKCWIYGHTHTPSNVIINEIPFLCNPIGYPNENKQINFNCFYSLSNN